MAERARALDLASLLSASAIYKKKNREGKKVKGKRKVPVPWFVRTATGLLCIGVGRVCSPQSRGKSNLACAVH